MTAAQRFVTGSLGAAAATSAIDTHELNEVIAQVRGTWVGTISFEATLDNTNWFSVEASPVDTTGANVRTITANAVVGIDCTDFEQVRLRMSAYTSGTATTRIEGSGGRR